MGQDGARRDLVASGLRSSKRALLEVSERVGLDESCVAVIAGVNCSRHRLEISAQYDYESFSITAEVRKRWS